MKWELWEVDLIKNAVTQINKGDSIYSHVEFLHLCLLNYRTWESIRSKINRMRKKNVGEVK